MGNRLTTAKEFGDRIGISKSMASRLLSGDRRASVGTLYAIHREFGIPAEDLVRAYVRGYLHELLYQELFCD